MTWKVLTAAIALCAMAVAGPALAQSVTSAPPPSENLLVLQARVDELEQLLRQATSESERLAIELRRVRNDNARLQQQIADAAGAPAPNGTGATDPPSPDPRAPPPGVAGTLGTLPAPAAGDAAQQLSEAMRLLQLGRFPEAEAAFATFARANPQSPDTPEARYFVGRTQIAQRHFPDAADTFVKLLADHPAIGRAPDSWLMLGVALKGMGKAPEACGVFRDLPVKYPRASANTRNQAAGEARTAQCAAR